MLGAGVGATGRVRGRRPRSSWPGELEAARDAAEQLGFGTGSDEQLLALWLFNQPEETRRAYAADVRGFLAHTGKAIQATTLGDVQGFVAGLGTLAPASRGRKLSAVKSLFGFAHRLGYTKSL